MVFFVVCWVWCGVFGLCLGIFGVVGLRGSLFEFTLLVPVYLCVLSCYLGVGGLRCGLRICILVR